MDQAGAQDKVRLDSNLYAARWFSFFHKIVKSQGLKLVEDCTGFDIDDEISGSNPRLQFVLES